MDYNTNDLLYAYMRSVSTAMPKDRKWKEYLLKSDYIKEKKTIAELCGCSVRTIENNLKKLIDSGLVVEGMEKFSANGKEYLYPVYLFPFDYDGKYTLIDIDVLRYLVNTRSKQAIRVYLYLLHKYNMKKGTGEFYTFTIAEIKKAMNYSETTKTADIMIRDILISLKYEGLLHFIKYTENKDIVFDNNIKTVPVERMKLLSVVNKKADLPNL